MNTPSDARELSLVIREFLHSAFEHGLSELVRFAKDRNLSMTQMAVLTRLEFEQSATVSQLSQIMGISNPAVSQLLDRLVQQGYAFRSTDEEDRRIRYHGLTATGSALVQESFGIRSSWVDGLVESIDTQDYLEMGKTFKLLKEKIATLPQNDFEHCCGLRNSRGTQE